MAHRLAQAGANVMLTGLEAEDAAAPVYRRIIDETGTDATYFRADLTDPMEIAALVDATRTAFGEVHILINNAVVRHFAPIERFPLEHWNRALAVNLTAALVATQHVLPGMRSANYGRIFNLTSVFGSRATVDRIDYVTTKAALQGFTRAVALEIADSAVTCHALMPGAVLTPAIEMRVEELMRSARIDRREAEIRFLDGKQPSGRFVEVDSIVEMMMLLCGPAGRDMNGAILPIEGGWLARS